MSIRKPILLITITATWGTIKEVFCEASALCATAMSSKAAGVRCDYCGHTAVDHLSLEPVTKRSRADNSLPKQDEVGEI